MKPRSMLVVILVLAACVLLAACAREEATTSSLLSISTTVSTAELETTVVSQTTTTALRPTTTTTLQEPVTFKLASPFADAELWGQAVEHFTEFISERTGGAVKFDLYPNGILGGPAEVLTLLETGGVDIALVSREAAAQALPLFNFPGSPPGEQQDALAYFNHLVFANPESSTLIQAEAQVHRLRYLDFLPMGARAFVSKTALNSLANLKGKKCAALDSVLALRALGLEVLDSPAARVYEKLSDGSIDCVYASFLAAAQLKWPEVAPYVVLDGTCAVDQLWIMSARAWAKVRPETQMVFVQAGKDLETWSSELVREEQERALRNLKAAGVTVETLAPEEQKLWWNTRFKVEADAQYESARDGGFLSDMLTILQAAASFTGTDWTAPGG